MNNLLKNIHIFISRLKRSQILWIFITNIFCSDYTVDYVYLKSVPRELVKEKICIERELKMFFISSLYLWKQSTNIHILESGAKLLYMYLFSIMYVWITPFFRIYENVWMCNNFRLMKDSFFCIKVLKTENLERIF